MPTPYWPYVAATSTTVSKTIKRRHVRPKLDLFNFHVAHPLLNLDVAGSEQFGTDQAREALEPRRPLRLHRDDLNVWKKSIGIECQCQQ